MSESETTEAAGAEPERESPRLVRRGWNPPIGGIWGWFTARRMRRLFITVAGVGLLIWLGWLVWGPFEHPRVQMVCLSGGDYAVLKAPPLAFAAEDIAGLTTLTNLFDERFGRAAPYVWDSLSEPAKARLLAAKLRGVADRSGDTLLIIASAHGMLEDGQPYLLCRNFDPGNPSAGRISFAEFLEQVRGCRAGNKIVILDIGRIASDPRLGFIWNDLANRAQDAVRDSGDESLWLMTTCQEGDRPQVAPAIDRSVFSYALQQGLFGAADGNADGVTSLLELYRYVSATTSDWTAHVSGGAADQYPLLAWGGKASAARAAAEVILAPVAADYDPEAVLPFAEQVKLTRKTSRGEAWQIALAGDKTAARAPKSTASQSNQTANSAAPDALTASLSRIRVAEVRSVGQLQAQAESSAREAGRNAADQATQEKPAEATPAPTEAASTAPSAAESETPTTAATAESPATPAASSDSTAAPATGAVAAGKNKTQRSAAPKKFIEAWNLRDAIAGLPGGAAPRDYAPHLWRELQRGLLDYELQYSAGKIGSLSRIQSGLDRIVAGEKLLVESATDPELAPTESGPARMLRFRPWAARQLEYAHSAAMERLIAESAGRTLAPEAQALLELPPDVATNAIALRARVAAFPPRSAKYTERAAADRLAAASDAQRAAELKAWQAETAAETLAAAGPWIVPWASVELDAADALRFDAERELANAIGPDYVARASQLFDQALARYQTAAENLDVVTRARRMQREYLERAPDYLRLQLARRNAAGADAFADYCEQLGSLSDLLATPDVARLSELRALTLSLATLERTLAQPLAPAALQELTSAPAQRGDPLKVDALLSTTLPAADARIKLLSIVARLDGRLISELKPLHGAVSAPQPTVDEIAVGAKIVAAARLHLALVNISGLSEVDGADDEKQVQDHFILLQTAQANLSSNPAASEEAFYAQRAFDRQLNVFQAALADFHAALPRRIADAAQANRDLEAPSTRSERVIQLRRVDRALRLLDARDARRAGDVPVAALIDAAEWHQLLTWHADRADRVAREGIGGNVQQWADASAAYRGEATKLFDAETGPATAAPRIVIEGPDSLDLSVEPDQEAKFTLKQTGETPADVWLVLNYDEESVKVETNSAYSWRREQDLPRSANPAERDAALLAEEPSLRLNPGQQVSFALNVRSLVRAARPARVVLRAVTREGSLRRTLSVILPAQDTVGVRVVGVPGSWTQEPTRVLLSPFPNRDNEYRWSLLNSGGGAKEVKVNLLALSRPMTISAPLGSLSAGEAAEFFEEVGSTKSLATVEKMPLPAGDTPIPIAFPAPPEDAAPAEGPPPPPVTFNEGMLLTITDLANGRVSVHRVDCAPQRPRRYVTPRVRYNAIDERIEIEVTAVDPAGMPGGAVRVSCTTAEPLPPGTQARLSDELRAPDYRATLWVSAPLDPARVITLALNVDDYPRAFIYRVPCQESGRDIPAEQNLMTARIDAPAEGAAFLAPAAPIDVKAAFDIPRGAEDDPDSVIEVGFDTDRDRDFRGETTTRLIGDRQVEEQLVSAAPGGVVVVHPKVGDYELKLTPPGLVNNRVGVMARAAWGDQSAFSESREIILDGTAPHVERVRVAPAGVAPIGDPIDASCLALDGDLSGVASVEMTIDQLGTADFEGNPPAMPAKLGPDRRWSAKLDTATVGAGTYHVLVRAKDKVGNESEINASAVVRLMTPEAIAGERRRATNRVSGTLLYGNSGFGGISVKLEAVPPAATDAAALAAGPPEPIAPVATNDQGAFAFDAVPPGKYKLTAEGVVRNKTRRAEAEVTVEPAPMAVRPVRLELR